MSNEEQPLSSPSAKKAKLSGSVDDTQTSKSSLSNSVPIVPEAEKEENLFYFLGCNDGKENVKKNKYK